MLIYSFQHYNYYYKKHIEAHTTVEPNLLYVNFDSAIFFSKTFFLFLLYRTKLKANLIAVFYFK
jgi:hypothetical protein